jgi:hypothetical protein
MPPLINHSRSALTLRLQRLTLALVVALMAKTLLREEKVACQHFVLPLCAIYRVFREKHPRVLCCDSRVGALWLLLTVVFCFYFSSLVHRLRLKSTLTEYNAPREYITKITEKALGRERDPLHSKVVKLLENLY